MIFEGFAEAQSVFLWVTFAIAVVLGATANKTNFCTMGAVSDWVNMGDLGRIRAWLLAIAVAMLGVVILENMGMVNVNAAFPPYRAAQLIWAENVLGGVMFGIGMTLASGCGNKTLVRIGGGNFKSLVVFAVMAACVVPGRVAATVRTSMNWIVVSSGSPRNRVTDRMSTTRARARNMR